MGGKKSRIEGEELAASRMSAFLLSVSVHVSSNALQCLIAGLFLALPISAQSPGFPIDPTQGPVQPGQRYPHQQTSNQSLPPAMAENRIKLLNRLRQKSIVDDTTKLLF